MTLKLSDALAVIAAQNGLEEGRLATRDVAVRWAPILSLGSSGGPIRMGIGPDEQGSTVWLIEGNAVLHPLNTGYWRALILLETPFPEIIDGIQKCTSLSPASFPAFDIVCAALQHQSDYWAKLALAWVPYLQLSEKKDLLETLNSLQSSRWASQKLRHTARKVAREILQADE